MSINEELQEIADAVDAILSSKSVVVPSLTHFRGEIELLKQGSPTLEEVQAMREKLFSEAANLSTPSSRRPVNDVSLDTLPEQLVVFRAPQIDQVGTDEEAVASLQRIADWAYEAGFESSPWGDTRLAIEPPPTAPSEDTKGRGTFRYSPLLLLLIPQGLFFAPFAVPAAVGAYAAMRLFGGVETVDAMAGREQRLTTFIVRLQEVCDTHRVPIQIMLTGLCFVGGAVVNAAPGIGQTISPVLLGAGSGGASLLARDFLRVLDLSQSVRLVQRGEFNALLSLLADTYLLLSSDSRASSSWPKYFSTVGLGAVAAGAPESAVIQGVVRVAGAASTVGSLPGLGLPAGTPVQSFILSFVGGSTNNPLTRKILEVVVYFLLESIGTSAIPASS